MYYVTRTDQLVADGILAPRQAREIQARSQAALIRLCVTVWVILGILAATLGLVFHLGNAASVIVFGAVVWGAGIVILRYGPANYRMMGNATAIIGAAMFIAASGYDLVARATDVAGPMMVVMGGVIAGLCVWRFRQGVPHLRFALAVILMMAVALHIVGVFYMVDFYDVGGRPMPFVQLYIAGVIAAVGYVLDFRMITALAIVPFAQILYAGTSYFSPVHVFYSPEPTLAIVLMAALIVVCLRVRGMGVVVGRQARVLMVMAFVVANLSFLVGSLKGDVVGDSFGGGGGLVVTAPQYAIIWAMLLGGLAFWAASEHRRGMFNVAMSLAVIHAYTQMFEGLYLEPLAYVIGGFAAIPLTFALWRLNESYFPQDPTEA